MNFIFYSAARLSFNSQDSQVRMKALPVTLLVTLLATLLATLLEALLEALPTALLVPIFYYKAILNEPQ